MGRLLSISNVTLQPRASSTSSVRWALSALSLSLLLSSLGTSIANVALPTLAQAFNATFPAVQWVVLAYLLAITTVIVSVGRLGDLLGRRRLLRAGLLLFTVASVVCGFASALWLVILGRAAQGVGAAVMMALTLSFVGDLTSKKRTGSAMGLLGSMSAIGTALGPSLGGLLIGWFGWRAIFLLNVPLGLLALFLVQRTLPADHAAPSDDAGSGKRLGFDGLGTLLLTFSLVAYALAMTLGHGFFSARQVVLLLAAAVGGVLFLRAELRTASPLIHPTLLQDPALGASLAANLLVSTVLMATLVVGPFYLSLALGQSAQLVGLIMSLGPIAAALVGVPAGRAVDRFGSHRTSLVALSGLTIGATMLSLARKTFGIPGYVLPIVIITAHYALFQTANNTAVLQNVSPDHKGVVSGMLNLSRNLGLISGTAVMGAVFTFATGTTDLTTASPSVIASGLRLTFTVAAALVLLALAAISVGRAQGSGLTAKSPR